jgi:hypothetical protein
MSSLTGSFQTLVSLAATVASAVRNSRIFNPAAHSTMIEQMNDEADISVDLASTSLDDTRQSEYEQALDFNPKLYVFKAPELIKIKEMRPPGEMLRYRVVCPGFHLLLDSAIGVIWHAFAHQGRGMRKLNIQQVNWTYRFLLGIRDENFENPALIEHLIKRFRKLLAVMYENYDEGDSEQNVEVQVGGSNMDVLPIAYSLADMVDAEQQIEMIQVDASGIQNSDEEDENDPVERIPCPDPRPCDVETLRKWRDQKMLQLELDKQFLVSLDEMIHDADKVTRRANNGQFFCIVVKFDVFTASI